MGEYSFRLYQLNLPRIIYKELNPVFGFKLVKVRKPLRYSLLQIGYAYLSVCAPLHHVQASLSSYFFDFG